MGLVNITTQTEMKETEMKDEHRLDFQSLFIFISQKSPEKTRTGQNPYMFRKS